MFEKEAEKRTKNCQEAYNNGFNDGYAVGLKAGKDMNVAKLHDLREDPNDLPKGGEAFLREEIMFEKKAEEYKLLHTHYEVAKREKGENYDKNLCKRWKC